jgi:hypothetical protein
MREKRSQHNTMTIRDLQRFVQEYEEQGQIGQSAETTRLVSNCPKTFYKWSDKNHWSYTANTAKQCCFWHWTGPPQKDGQKTVCQSKYYKKNNMNPALYMKVIPIPFSVNGAKMLQHTKSLLEDKDNLIAIDKGFDKLLTALRTAAANKYKLDKEQTSYHDLLDAFRLSLQLYQRSNK